MTAAKLKICDGQVVVEILARGLGHYEMRIECGDTGATSFSMTPSELHELLKLIRQAQRSMMELKARGKAK